MKEIYFIRHGQTDSNLYKRTQGGGIDTELNNTGKMEAKYTGKYIKDYRLKDKQFDLVISSPLKRAKQTTNIICNIIKYDKNKIIYDENLIEQDKGELGNGMTFEEMKKDKKFKKFIDIDEKTEKIKDPIEFIEQLYNKKYSDVLEKYYKHEHLDKFKKRVNKVINFIKKSNAKKILVVCHNGTIMRAIIPLLCNTVIMDTNFKYGKNCHISYFKYDKNKFTLIRSPNTIHFSLYNKNFSKNK